MAEVKEKVFRTASGEILTEDDIEKIADEVESDEPVVFTAVRPVGRPSLDGNGTSPRLSFRVAGRARDAPAGHVFWMTMLGNFAEKSSAFCATKIATLRAIAL